MKLTSSALMTVGSLLFSVASAHFTLDYPTSRGFDEDLEPNFCGGFNVSSTRQPYPLGTAPLLIDSHHPSADVFILVSFDANPTNFTAFNTTDSGVTYPPLRPAGQITGTGEFCFDVDIQSLGIAGVGNGSLATIQVVFNGGDGVLLQCADLILLTNFTVPSNITCANITSTATTSSSAASTTASGSTSAPAATSSKPAGAGKVGVVGGLILGMVGLVTLVV